jgi:predicted AAA+ superfamily ATPase
MSGGAVEGVLITGVYGAGKSSVAEEIADALEARGARFGAVDLDWLMWFGVPSVEPDNLRRGFLANLAAVERRQLHALRSVWDELLGPARRHDALAQVVHLLLWNLEVEGPDLGCGLDGAHDDLLC